MNLTVKQLRLFVEYISSDVPYTAMCRADYNQLSTVLWEFPVQYMLKPEEYMRREWYHFAVARKSLIPSSGILSITGKQEARKFAEACDHDGMMYRVYPRPGSLILNVQKLAEEMHERGLLEWAFLRRTQQENEYIYVNPTIDCCKKTTL